MLRVTAMAILNELTYLLTQVHAKRDVSSIARLGDAAAGAGAATTEQRQLSGDRGGRRVAGSGPGRPRRRVVSTLARSQSLGDAAPRLSRLRQRQHGDARRRR